MKQATLAESIYEKIMTSFKEVFDPNTGRVVDFFPGTSLVSEFEASDEEGKTRPFGKDEQGALNQRYYNKKIKTQSATNAEILDLAYGITCMQKKANTIPYRVAVDVYNFHNDKSTEQSNPLLMDIIKLKKNYASISNYSKNLKQTVCNTKKDRFLSTDVQKNGNDRCSIGIWTKNR